MRKAEPTWPDGRFAVLLLVALGAGSSLILGHQDVVLDWRRDGTLSGLPAEYEPATLTVDVASTMQDTRVALQLRDNLVEFPECLSILFVKAKRSAIRLSASWYHDPEVLPYYLSIRLPTRRIHKHGVFDGWSVLVALETGELIRVEAEFASDQGYAQRGQAIDLKAFCTADELAQVAPQKIDADGH